jgi:hypothetical protein
MNSTPFKIFQILFNLSFLLSLNYKVFRTQILHAHSVRIWQYSDIFFRIFLKLLNVDFEKIQKRAPGRTSSKAIFRSGSVLLSALVPASYSWIYRWYGVYLHNCFVCMAMLQSDFSSGTVSYRWSFHCPFLPRDSRWWYKPVFVRMWPSCTEYVVQSTVHLLPNT